MLNVIYADFHLCCHYAECHLCSVSLMQCVIKLSVIYAECHYAGCHNAECRGAAIILLEKMKRKIIEEVPKIHFFFCLHFKKKSFLVKCGESRVGLEKISLQMSYIKNVFLES